MFFFSFCEFILFSPQQLSPHIIAEKICLTYDYAVTKISVNFVVVVFLVYLKIIVTYIFNFRLFCNTKFLTRTNSLVESRYVKYYYETTIA